MISNLMITDNQTNTLYLSDKLSKFLPEFYSDLKDIISIQNINFKLLHNTKDIWAVDYMPVQITKDKFIQFKYFPDYLNTKKWKNTISNVDEVCEILNLNIIKSDIILDGGNIIKWNNKVIMCDKIFDENSHLTQKELINELYKLLEVDKIIFIPKHPKDIIGHADAMIRFIDEHNVLVNDYSKENISFQKSFRLALYNAGLDYVEFPYNPYSNSNYEEAVGEYINYLQMKDFILLPKFNLKEDEKAFKILNQIYPKYKIETLECIELAKRGGVLNCISWNVLS